MSPEEQGSATQGASGAQVAPGGRVDDVPRTRRELLGRGWLAAAASVLGVLGVAAGASGKNGDPVRAGEKTSATSGTTLESRKGPAFQGRVAGGPGVGLKGSASSPKGIGVQGEATSEKGASVGVQGLSRSPAGVAGQFTADGGGVAVEATSSGKGGVALRTKGRIELRERSGVSPVSGGAEFVIPVAGGLSDKSVVLATLQDHFPGIHVESASVLDAKEGLIVVRLSQAVPEPARVGWIVLD